METSYQRQDSKAEALEALKALFFDARDGKTAAVPFVKVHDFIEALQRDAERYRWLSDERSNTSPLITEGWEDAPVLLKGESLDAAIDAALSSQSEARS